MAERLKVEWTNQALQDLEAIHHFLLINWTDREAERFLDLAQEFEIFISRFPLAFNASRKRKLYRLGLIHKNVTAVYRVDSGRITIISLQDNRSKSKFR